MPPRLHTLLSAVTVLSLLLGYLPWQVAQWTASVALLPTICSYLSVLFFLGGAMLFFAGAYYLSWRGDGSPFSIHPPKRMVVAGPYARLQHPMTLGVLLMVYAEALWCGSMGLVAYAVVLTLVAKLYLLFVEEPRLERHFGDDYRAYRNAMPQWLPLRRKARNDER